VRALSTVLDLVVVVLQHGHVELVVGRSPKQNTKELGE
jgi:hypothetical protein